MPPSDNESERISSPPPGDRFDPAVLDRTVIALPLLKKIEAEKALVQEVKKDWPDAAQQYNSVISLAPDRVVEEARAELQSVLDEATQEVDVRVKDADRPGWQEARARFAVGPVLPMAHGFFAVLDTRLIRRVNVLKARWENRHGMPPFIVDRILPTRFQVIIDLNLEYAAGRNKAREWVEWALGEAKQRADVNDAGQVINLEKSRNTNQYVFATIEARVIAHLVDMDGESTGLSDGNPKLEALRDFPLSPATPPPAGSAMPTPASVGDAKLAKEAVTSDRQLPPRLRAIYRIWPDFEIKTNITRSISTVKASAAINSFSARGTNITWAVLDTGIQGDHLHFARHQNIASPALGLHADFTDDGDGPLVDSNGHGTHVAGIIAGEWTAPPEGDPRVPKKVRSITRFQDEHGDAQQEMRELTAISGMAPECQLVSLKVLDENGIGNASNLISAIAHVQEINGNGRRLLIQGMNISIGYDFDPKWFACGQSPLCVEVNRLVRSGVVVVVAAGNTGYGAVNNGSSSAGLTVTINDPGNAELAITVGATHRDMPHTYGVSYFSSKGPTGDGRLKPDLVAPGEKIVSCAGTLASGAPSALKREVARDQPCEYIETSGTSMAAPHVSGVVAAFLSVRQEYIGQPEQVKQIFISSATDLRRDRYFQGAGLIDLMRAIQSV